MGGELADVAPRTPERVEADMSFHRWIALTSKNLLLFRLLNEVPDIAVAMREHLVARLARGRARYGFPLDNLDIAQAIRRGAPDVAEGLILLDLVGIRRKCELAETDSADGAPKYGQTHRNVLTKGFAVNDGVYV